MNDSLLLLTGISVFGLMVIGMVLTVMEFRSVTKRHAKRESGRSRSNDTEK